MTDWKEYKLGEIAELRKEKFTPDKIRLYPYIGLEHIEPKSLRLNGTGLSSDVTSQKSVFYPNDILYGKLRPYFQKVYSPQFKGVCSTDIFVVKPKKGIHPKFLFYLFASDEFTTMANQGSTGTRMPRADWKHLSTTNWHLPDLPTQSAIAEILSSLDDKIELNNQINQNLEALAQALFKQWFVDFEFPNENGEPYKSSGGEMVDSELGEIPKGWKVYFLNELVECFDSKRVPLSSMERNLRKGEFPYYGAASLMDYIDDYLFEGNYILMGEDGSVTTTEGFPVLQYVSGKFWVNNHAHVLKGKAISTELIHCLLRKTNITHLVTGAVQPKLNQGNMNKIFMFLPSNLSEIEMFEDMIQSFYSQIRENKVENDHLINLRDSLLPKLISGELEVKEAMEQIS